MRILRTLPALGLLAAASLGSTCNQDESTGGRPTETAQTARSEAAPIESGCPDEEPVKRVDLNRDGNWDIFEIPENGGVCHAIDMNYDGQIDLIRHRDAGGAVIREEADGDHDGVIDVAADYRGPAQPGREQFDSNWDGKVDLWVDFAVSCRFTAAAQVGCTSDCGVPWCRPRLPPVDPTVGPAPAEAAPTSIAVLYRDSTADGLWDTAEVLLDGNPICVGFNANVSGETPENVTPETVEVYKPASARLGRPDIDYLRRDYLDLSGNPIVRCEDSDGAIIDCPSQCGG